MKPDARNIAATILLVASSLGIGRTGFVWHERIEEQAARIGDLEDQILQARGANAALAHNLAVAQRRAASFYEGPSEVPMPSDDSGEVVSVVTPAAPEAPEIDIAFIQSAMEQIQALQDQQNTVVASDPTPTTPTKTATDTPKKRSRTTRAS